MSTTSTNHYDVTILGGGLAGLTCALHCRKETPDAKIAIIEKKGHPVPESAHKVGESSVEVGADYFRRYLELEDHLENDQIPKLGLRMFFKKDDNAHIEDRLEMGGVTFPHAPSYQFDRGRFENFLAKRCESQGVEFIDMATVKEIDLNNGKTPHQISYEQNGEKGNVSCRWLVDASGRAGLLKRKLGLKKESEHRGNSAWLRIGTRVKVDEWSDDAEWQKNHSEENARWRSTNHLLGEGYWIWIIPLSSGSTSIGIVADEKCHDLSGFNSQEKMLQWLEEREPQLAADLRKDESEIQDFCAIKRYSMECETVYSRKRWGIIGDAGFFIDPFYSPGNDFIAIGNTYLNELIHRDLNGKSNFFLAPFYNAMFKNFYRGTEMIFKDNYPVFGNHQVMPIKILWDWMIYWSITGHVVMQGKLTDSKMYLKHKKHLKRLNLLNKDMQNHFRRWNVMEPAREISGNVRLCDLCLVMGTNKALMDNLSDQEFAERFDQRINQLETLFWEVIDYSGIEAETTVKRRELSDTVKGGFQQVMDVLMKAAGENGASEMDDKDGDGTCEGVAVASSTPVAAG